MLEGEASVNEELSELPSTRVYGLFSVAGLLHRILPHPSIVHMHGWELKPCARGHCFALASEERLSLGKVVSLRSVAATLRTRRPSGPWRLCCQVQSPEWIFQTLPHHGSEAELATVLAVIPCSWIGEFFVCAHGTCCARLKRRTMYMFLGRGSNPQNPNALASKSLTYMLRTAMCSSVDASIADHRHASISHKLDSSRV